MKVICAGSRSITDYSLVKEAIESSGFTITELVSGHQNGVYDNDNIWCPTVDLLGEKWAKENDIPITTFPANWAKFGKRAGPLRNAEMSKFADALVAVSDGESKGTANMIEEMRKQGKPIYIRIFKGA